jgi:hypothetical protein
MTCNNALAESFSCVEIINAMLVFFISFDCEPFPSNPTSDSNTFRHHRTVSFACNARRETTAHRSYSACEKKQRSAHNDMQIEQQITQEYLILNAGAIESSEFLAIVIRRSIVVANRWQLIQSRQTYAYTFDVDVHSTKRTQGEQQMNLCRRRLRDRWCQRRAQSIAPLPAFD